LRFFRKIPSIPRKKENKRKKKKLRVYGGRISGKCPWISKRGDLKGLPGGLGGGGGGFKLARRILPLIRIQGGGPFTGRGRPKKRKNPFRIEKKVILT